MKRIAKVFTLLACLLPIGSIQSLKPQALKTQSTQVLSFEGNLERRVEQFDTSGHSFVASVLELAYQYELPMGIEFMDRETATRPINLEFRDETVRGILLTIIGQAPEYRVSFSAGLVDIYSPKARDDSTNLFNRVIKDFEIRELDTHDADLALFCALGRQLVPPSSCFGSVAIGQWGATKITVRQQNAKVYEILNAIVARNGKAVWAVTAPPERLSKIPVGGFWHIYPLEPPFKIAVLEKLTSMANDDHNSQVEALNSGPTGRVL
jgi:hypothetical protein